MLNADLLRLAAANLETEAQAHYDRATMLYPGHVSHDRRYREALEQAIPASVQTDRGGLVKP